MRSGAEFQRTFKPRMPPVVTQRSTRVFSLIETSYHDHAFLSFHLR